MERTKPPNGEDSKKPTRARYLIPVWAYDILIHEDNPSELITLFAFYCRASVYQHTNRVWANDQFCMKGTKLGKDRFYRAKQRLIELGLIEVIKGERKSGQFSKDYIKVNQGLNPFNVNARTHTKNGGHDRCTENSTLSNNGGHDRCTENPHMGNQYTNTFNKKVKTNTCKNVDVGSSLMEKINSSMFDKFWNLYPKQVDKGKALTAWNKLCQNNDRPTWREIRRAILLQKKSPRWQNPQFIPHPANWLSNNRWMDDPKAMIVWNKKDEICPIGWVFGQDFSNRQGCLNCEDDSPKLHQRCRIKYQELRQYQQFD